MGSSVLRSTLSPYIATSSPVLLLGWITPCASSGPVPLVTSLVSVSCAVLVAVLGRVPNADDPPCETEGRGVDSYSVSLGFSLGMTDSTGPFQYASHSWILDRVPLNCIGHCAIDSFVSRSQQCPLSLPSTGLRSSSSMLHCALAVSLESS